MGRPHLLLLHGALGAKTQFQTLIPYLQEYFTLHSFDFEAHGQFKLKDRPFREVHFAGNVLDYKNRPEPQTKGGLRISLTKPVIAHPFKG